MSRTIDADTYTKIMDARRTLCDYCENDACENCIVTHLADDAYAEADEAGIIDESGNLLD